MKHVQSGNSQVLILQRGEELIESLNSFAAEQKLNSAWLSGLGGAGRVELGFYDLNKRDYDWQVYDGPLEILSLTGNLTIVDGQPFWHVHGVFSGTDFQAIGGHVRNMEVELTAELHITPLKTLLTRTFDDQTGLKLIDHSD